MMTLLTLPVSLKNLVWFEMEGKGIFNRAVNGCKMRCLSDVTLTWGEMGQLGDWGWLSVTREKGGGGGTEYKWFYSLHALYPASPVTRPGLGLLDPGQLLAPPGSGAGLGAKIKYFAATKLAELIQNNGTIHCKGFWAVFWSEEMEIRRGLRG